MKKPLVFVLSIVLSGTLLAGCGVHPVARENPSVPRASQAPQLSTAASPATSQTNPGVSPPTQSSLPSPTTLTNFPGIIQTALISLRHRTQISLYAPTTYPGEAHTPLPISVQTQTGTNPTRFYQLLFNRGGQNIGSFTVRQWPSTVVAQTHIILVTTNEPHGSPVSRASVTLGDGIVGLQTQWKNVEEKSIDTITWHEGRWHLIVEDPSSQVTEGVRVAQRINTYLQTTSLPVPSTQGWVVANLSEQIVNMQVSWDHNALTFLTASTGPWNSNLSGGYLSALDMATHIQKN
ncbi:MAG: hypothetical protein C7B44_08820 [Sulfobacillus thermosulfidooxidans]|nr:MAG: hypothetical protein C7B44_08820 [Sulfobacillus thermosulfidooxidans]